MTDDAPADPLDRAAAELGEPDAVYAVSPGRVRVKLAVAVALLGYGVAANYVWWALGPARFNHLVLLALFVPPATGVSILRHVLRHRGLHVLAYQTGLLRVHGDEVESYPWAEVTEVRLRADRGTVVVERDETGRVAACCVVVQPPLVKVWEAGVTVRRADGTETTFTPALADYAGLVARVQIGTFAVLWSGVQDRFRAGEPLAFGSFEATAAGLAFGKGVLPWAEVGTAEVAQKNLTVKRIGKWLPWAVAEVAAVPNPHLLLALIEEAKWATAKPDEGEAEDL